MERVQVNNKRVCLGFLVSIRVVNVLRFCSVSEAEDVGISCDDPMCVTVLFSPRECGCVMWYFLIRFVILSSRRPFPSPENAKRLWCWKVRQR